MMEFEQHPTEPNTIVIKMPTYYIAKHSDEDLQAAVLAEREACAKLCEELRDEDGYECWGTECAVAIRTKDMSTKPQNVNTSEERVHESDKSIHDDDDIQEYKKPWVGLTDDEMSDTYNCHYNEYVSNDIGIVDFIVIARAIEAKLKEKNT